jgi:hypothetical protein
VVSDNSIHKASLNITHTSESTGRAKVHHNNQRFFGYLESTPSLITKASHKLYIVQLTFTNHRSQLLVRIIQQSLKSTFSIANDSTRPAMDLSGPGPSSTVEFSPSNFLDWDGISLKFCWTGRAWSGLVLWLYSGLGLYLLFLARKLEKITQLHQISSQNCYSHLRW